MPTPARGIDPSVVPPPPSDASDQPPRTLPYGNPDLKPNRLPPPEERLQLGWLDALVRHKRWAFAAVVFVYLLCFNGLWRVGLDSALYRCLARSIAAGHGYTVAGEPHHHAFPGMPLLLAGIERLFGDSALPGVIAVTLMAFAILAVTYRLIALRYPAWIATVVTIGVGLNFRVLRQSQELMTDIPFALGVVLSFWGLERLRLAARDGPLFRRANLLSAFIMIGGLALAAVMRPTFGVLALAIVAASCWRLVFNGDGRRALHVTILATVALVTIGLIVSDPRTSGHIPFKGGIYEQELIDGVRDLHRTIWKQLDDLMARDLNDAFYSQDMAIDRVRVHGVAPFGVAFSLILLAGTFCVIRRDLAWGLSILGIMAITLPLSTVPRYFIMVMPFLWLGWVLLITNLTLRVPAKAQGAVMMIGLLIPIGMNLGRTMSLVKEQRQAEYRVWTGKAPDRETAFLQSFRGGDVLDWQRWAKIIHDHVPANARVVGPEASVLAYYADRRVFGERAIFLDHPPKQFPTMLRDWKPDYAIFPGACYSDADSRLRDLINRRVMERGQKVAADAKAYLCTAIVNVPADAENWRTPRKGATKLAANTHRAAAAHQPTSQPSTQPAKKGKKAHTTPATASSTQPANHSATSKHHPSTRPAATQPTTPVTAASQPTTAPTAKRKKPTHPHAVVDSTTQSADPPTTKRATKSGKSAADARDVRHAREVRERNQRAATQPTTTP